MIDPQLKRGMLDICVLALLRKGDSYGYQIIKDLSGCIELSESTLYPILRRLETGGCLEVYSVAHSGRLRKFYRITELGNHQIEEFIAGWKEIQQVYDFIGGLIGSEEAPEVEGNESELVPDTGDNGALFYALA